MSRIDVEYRADGISLILASHGFSMSVELSHSQADDLLELLISQQSASTGHRTDSEGDRREFAQQARDALGVSCKEVGSE